MSNELQNARNLVEGLRFSGDSRGEYDNSGDHRLTAARNHFYQNSLRICEEVTPDINKRLGNVYQRLKIPDAAVEAFVYPSAEIQAACISDGSNACIIQFSSTLIETLSAEEFEFVAGHELGHFLLGHGAVHIKKESLEHFMQSRAQEISADRIGLTACESLDIAIRAMMKTISGLTGRHLRFDAGTFIAQLKNQSSQDSEQASHPSMLVRCRALLWFSTIGDSLKDKEQNASARTKLDKRIETDFQKYVDGPVRKKIERAKKDLSMWLATSHIVKDNRFSKEEQKKFARLFGERELEGLKNYLRAIPVDKIQGTINERMERAQDALRAMIPRSFAEEMAKIEQLVCKQLS